MAKIHSKVWQSKFKANRASCIERFEYCYRFMFPQSREWTRRAIKKQIEKEKRSRIKVSEPERDRKKERMKWFKRERMSVSFTNEKHEEGHCVEEATVTEITFHTEDRDSTFLCLRKSGGKSPTLTLEWCKHIPRNAHTHLPFRQNMAPHSFPRLSTRNKQRLLSLLFLFTLSWFSSLPRSLFLYSTRSKRPHTDTRIPTHTHSSLPFASRHLPPSLSPLIHTCTRSEWQLANFYTTGNCLATPPFCFPPPSLSLPASLNISPPSWQPPFPSLHPPISVKR